MTHFILIVAFANSITLFRMADERSCRDLAAAIMTSYAPPSTAPDVRCVATFEAENLSRARPIRR